MQASERRGIRAILRTVSTGAAIPAKLADPRRAHLRERPVARAEKYGSSIRAIAPREVDPERTRPGWEDGVTADDGLPQIEANGPKRVGLILRPSRRWFLGFGSTMRFYLDRRFRQTPPNAVPVMHR
jgi:hypothetical protein